MDEELVLAIAFAEAVSVSAGLIGRAFKMPSRIELLLIRIAYT